MISIQDQVNKKEKIKESEKVKNIKFNILAITCIILFCTVLAPVTLQNDTYYTIKIGELIVNTGKVDMQDHFSWHTGLPYSYPHWAYDVATYLIYNLWSFTGIFVSTIILSCILGISIYVTNKKISKNKLVSFILTLGAMYLIKDYIAARAQLVSFILLELTILCIEKFLETKKIRYAVFLFLIAIAIANIHCAVWPFFFVLFLPYIAEYLITLDYTKMIYWMKNKYYQHQLKKYSSNKKKYKNAEEEISKINAKFEKTKEDETKKLANREKQINNPYKIKTVKISAVKWLIVVMIVCALAGLLTPIGDMPYVHLYKLMQGNSTQSISEHLPLTLINNKPIMIILAFLIAILAFTNVKIRWKDLFMLAGLALMMFMTRRQVSMFAIFGSAILATLISDLFAKYDKDGTVEMEKIMTTTLGTVATVLVVALFMIVQIKGEVNDKYVNEKSYPVEAAEYIKNNIDMSKMRLFNEYNYGSYLIYEGIPVFIDSRCDLYTPQFNKTEDYPDGRDIFTDYINTSNISRYYEKTFDQYDITHIILYKNSKLSMLLSKDPDHYTSIYSDDNFIIYQRNVD